MIMMNKKVITEKNYNYYYKDLIDGATYKVESYFIADITFNMCRLSFKDCDFSKRVEVDFETLDDVKSRGEKCNNCKGITLYPDEQCAVCNRLG